ncbi:MAG TPA: amino acid ABC transporter substrate-binding protein, partial [Clostridiales bacterium]|nr:amino acid ABC transporter substrate-binding protein [Clostridiales bacterium]
MKKRRKITAAVLAVFLMLSVFMMTSCQEAAEKQSLEQIKDAGVLTVYTNAEFPPFEYM